MAEIREEVIVDVRIEQADTETRVSQLTKRIAELKADTDKLNETNKKLAQFGRENTAVYRENSQGIEINKQLIQEATAERKNLIATLLSEDKSIQALNARNRELVRQRNQLSTATAEGRAQIALINQEIDKNTATIRANSSSVEDQRMNIGNYASALDQVQPGLGNMVNRHVEMAKTLPKAVMAISGVTAALGAMYAAYIRSIEGARDLRKAQDLVSASLDVLSEDFYRFVKQVSGPNGMGALESLAFGFTQYFFGLSNAVKAKITADAQDMLRELEISRRFAEQFYQKDRQEAELQSRIRDDVTKSMEERLAAARKVDEYMQTAAERQVVVLEAQIRAIKESATNYERNREAQVRVAEIETRIANIRQRVTRLLTENAMAVIRLREEYSKLAREARLATLDRELQEQHEAFMKATNGIFGELEWLREQEVKATIRFNDRLAKETEARKKKEEADRKTRLKEEMEARRTIQQQSAKAQDELFGTWDNMIEARFNREIARAEQHEKAKLALLDRRLREGLITEGQYEKQKQAILQQSEEKQDEIRRRAFKKQQALQISETLVNTYQSAVAAYKALVGIVPIGPVLAPIAAAAAVAFGLSQVNLIKSQGAGFAEGGLVPGYARGGLSGMRIGPHHGIPIKRSNGDNLLATVKTGEVILNERQQAALGGARTFRAIGVPGFAGGGLAGMAATSTADSRARIAAQDLRIEQALREVKPVLVLQDFEAASEAKNTPIQRAQVI